MSTSTSERGDCSRCGHGMSGHTAAKHSKCRKCGQRFVICQAGTHGHSHMGFNPAGWRICYVPCYCGKKYYPDTAKAATVLQSWEYTPGHEAYRPLEDAGYDSEEQLDEVEQEGYGNYEGPGESSSFAAAAVQEEGLQLEEQDIVADQMRNLADQFSLVPLDDDGQDESAEPPAVPDEEFTYVDIHIGQGKHIYFRHDGKEYKSRRSDWEYREDDDESTDETCFFYQNRLMPSFLSLELPSRERDDAYIEATEDKGKGKEKAQEGGGARRGKEPAKDQREGGRAKREGKDKPEEKEKGKEVAEDKDTAKGKEKERGSVKGKTQKAAEDGETAKGNENKGSRIKAKEKEKARVPEKGKDKKKRS